MLKRDPNAKFVPMGCLIRKQQFQSGRIASSVMMGTSQFQQLLSMQAKAPVKVCWYPGNSRSWWMYQDEFYWEDEGFAPHEVQALILERKRKKARQVERAVAAMTGEVAQRGRRERISDDVQAQVWNRDGGCCVKCGSQERLEFDHIIPVSKGGSNTARNLQLLCETCNRSKGASIG